MLSRHLAGQAWGRGEEAWAAPRGLGPRWVPLGAACPRPWVVGCPPALPAWSLWSGRPGQELM